jgi:amino acid transporter
MATAQESGLGLAEQPLEKGLKSGALGLLSAIVMGVASTAPAYSLAATLGFIVVAVGLQAPIVAVLAFVPMLLTSIGYSEMNKADPDCGTTFTWASRAFGPRLGWAGGWAIVAADILVMASLAQVASVYFFDLIGAHGIASSPTGGWVLLGGIVWMILMGYICFRGIEVSARLQQALLSIEIVMLLLLSVVALVRVGTGHHPAVSVTPSLDWLNPFHISSFSSFISGLILMLFIYWGWDTSVAINEETRDRDKTPGRAAVISTVILLFTYVIVIFATQAFAGVGGSGIGLGNQNNANDVLSVLGSSVFGSSGIGSVLSKLLVLMVLSSAAASTQTTILPTARTTLSMAAYKALPRSFARVHPRFLTPTVSTFLMVAVSIVIYIPFNYVSGGNVIADAVTAIGLYIAFYYGLTAFTCVWYYRKTLRSSARNLWMRGILPLAGGLMMYFCGGWALWEDYDVNTQNSYTMWTVPGIHWQIGGVFLIAAGSAVAGVVFGVYCWRRGPEFFRRETLTRTTPTLVPDPDPDAGVVPQGGESA